MELAMADDPITSLKEGYACKGDYLVLGAALHKGEVLAGTRVTVPLRTMNRHGLICGTTGSGKTKTLQVIAEQLSMKGVPVLLMDVKGDLSGLAAPGTPNEKIALRHARLDLPYEPAAMPVELLSMSDGPGVRMRATVSEFGPVLLGRIMGLNDTQQGVLSLVFKYCDDAGLPLLDLKDLRRVLQFVTDEGKEAIRKQYGQVSSATVNIILRKLIEIEQQGAGSFFGERSFDVQDLLPLRDGKGVVHIVRLADIQQKPKLFSTFMLCLLAEIYSTFPEVGDPEKPRLVLFIDEAHLVFDTATKALLEQIETIIRLIRSKGVGVFFCTQVPGDIPESVLGQLGLKVQHTLRAFTAKDRTAIKMAAQNYPLTTLYDTETLITSMGIGEALVTALNENGGATPLAHTLLRAPVSRMDILGPLEVDGLVARSRLAPKYNEVFDRESAFEMLEERIRKAGEGSDEEGPVQPGRTGRPTGTARKKTTVVEDITRNPMVREVGRTVLRELTRGLLGVLGIRSRR